MDCRQAGCGSASCRRRAGCRSRRASGGAHRRPNRTRIQLAADETGIGNVIVRPDVFTEQRLVIVHEPFVIVEGVLQQRDGVSSVRAERVLPLAGRAPAVGSHDFH